MRRTVKITTDIEPLFGTLDENLKRFEAVLKVSTHLNDDSLELEGEPEQVERAERFLRDYMALVKEGHRLDNGEVQALLRVFEQDSRVSVRELMEAPRPKLFGRKAVSPKSPNQRAYLEAIQTHDMVFTIGPGGTGKTYLAVAMAVSALLSKAVDRIILVRPAVEAGERLGYLPGTVQEKVDPYMRPLYDALYDLLEADKLARLLEKGVIEVAPLAFMRGRTLNSSFVILDEAQNTTSEQMKMFLTRLGFNSKAVITGDITQIDLPATRRSGLIEALDVVGSIGEIAIVRFNERDVVRHNLVQQIIKAYETYENEQGTSRSLGTPASKGAED
ncbi:MAG: PhoH family protein [Candidatus Acidiferrales bacterium]